MEGKYVFSMLNQSCVTRISLYNSLYTIQYNTIITITQGQMLSFSL